MKTLMIFLLATMTVSVFANTGNTIKGDLDEHPGSPEYFIVRLPRLQIAHEQYNINADKESAQAVCTAFGSRAKLKGTSTRYEIDLPFASLFDGNTDYEIQTKTGYVLNEVICKR